MDAILQFDLPLDGGNSDSTLAPPEVRPHLPASRARLPGGDVMCPQWGSENGGVREPYDNQDAVEFPCYWQIASVARVGPPCQQTRPVNGRNRRIRTGESGVRPQPWGCVCSTARPLFQPERIDDSQKLAKRCGYGRGNYQALMSRKPWRRVGVERRWLNHHLPQGVSQPRATH